MIDLTSGKKRVNILYAASKPVHTKKLLKGNTLNPQSNIFYDALFCWVHPVSIRAGDLSGSSDPLWIPRNTGLPPAVII